MIVLSLTEEDRDLLLLLSKEARDSVMLSLLTGNENVADEKAKIVYAKIKQGEERRKKDRERKKMVRGSESPRTFHGVSKEFPKTPPSPPSPPFLPPSPSSPEPPLSSPPYNPPSPSPTTRRARGRSDAEFAVFWSAYPKKVGKKSARKAFDHVSEPVESLVTAIKRQECSAQWSRDGGQYIPNPTTWLNQERWEDQLPQRPSANPFLDMLEELDES